MIFFKQLATPLALLPHSQLQCMFLTRNFLLYNTYIDTYDILNSVTLG